MRRQALTKITMILLWVFLYPIKPCEKGKDFGKRFIGSLSLPVVMVCAIITFAVHAGVVELADTQV